jgi:penicillin-binding protein 2
MLPSVRIKDHHAEQRLFDGRAITVVILMFLAFGAVIARLGWMQISQFEHFTVLSQGNQIRIEPVPPNRGLILDRNGKPLATNTPSYQLELVREQVANLDETLKGLVGLGLFEQADIPALKRDILGRRKFESIPIKLQLGEEELSRFAVHRHDFPGVEIKPRLTRFYPLGPSAVHALGYVAAINEADKKTLDPEQYRGTTLAGKSGVERAYEKELHGQTGFQQILVNAQGRRVERVGFDAIKLERREPLAGDDIYLTIDERLQKSTEDMLEGKRAAVVAIDPANGDILAFVSTPSFDPNLFARGLSRKQYLALTQDIDRPLFDRVIRGVYPPGSTIKPFMALTALEYGVLAPDDKKYCRGFFTLPGSSHRYRDWKKNGHGAIDMRGAIMESCDIYFYTVADMVGVDRIHEFLNQFGFGTITGIDVDGEKAGILPSTAWKKKAFKRAALQQWYRGETVITGIGQGYMSLTPLQLAHATAIMAAKGQRFKPRLVRAIRSAQTGELRELPPEELPPVRVKDPAFWDTPRQGMLDVTTGPRGTARAAAAGAKYGIAGKTGTAQVFSIGQQERYKESEISERLLDHALFVAYAPADAPKIAVAVVVENGKHGGSTAAPIARRVFDEYLLSPEELAAEEAKRQAKAVKAGAAQGAPPPPAADDE